jgi:flagellar basal-body rod modification protein FlgD
MISSTAGVATVDTNATTTSSSSDVTATSQSDRFLKLLVAQMKNQDPLNPLDNAQVTTQMAQISTVSGIEKLNQTLQAFTQAQAFQAVGMVGRSVLVPGNNLELSGGQAVAGVDLSQAVDSMDVSVLDANGSVVRTMSLGKHDAGVAMFPWNGLDNNGNALPDGSYSFRVNAVATGKSTSATSLALGQVSSVLMDKSGPALSVSGVGLVGIDQVREIL